MHSLRRTRSFQSTAFVVSARLAALVLVCALLTAAHPSFAAPTAPARYSIHGQQSEDKLIKQVGFGPKGEWLILYGLNGYSSKGLDNKVTDQLAKVNDATEEIQWVAFGPDGAWLMSTAKSFYFGSLPDDLKKELDSLIKDGKGNDIKYVAFAPDGGWIIIWGTNGYTANNLPKTAVAEIKKLNEDSKEIKQLTFDSNGEWVIVYGTNGLVWSDNAAKGLIDTLKTINDSGDTIRQVSFSPDDGKSGVGWVVLYGKDKILGDNLPKTFVDKMKELDPTLK